MMIKPPLGKSRLQDFLYYLFNRGESLEHTHVFPSSTHAITYEIGIIAVTQQEAEQVLARIANVMRKHQPTPTKQRFTAYGLDQAWRPVQFFTEIHWIQSCNDKPTPQKLLMELGSIVHIHLFNNVNSNLQPPLRTYRWRSINDLTDFLASLYLSQETCSLLTLDWESYCRWQPAADFMITVESGWGLMPKEATQALINQTTASPSSSNSPILIIEADSQARIGDYIDMVGVLERHLGYDLVTSLWVSHNYSGFGLKLVRYHYPSLTSNTPNGNLA